MRPGHLQARPAQPRSREEPVREAGVVRPCANVSRHAGRSDLCCGCDNRVSGRSPPRHSSCISGPPKTKVTHPTSYVSHLYCGAGSRYLAHIGVILKTAEYTTGRASRESAKLLSSGPNGRGAAQPPAPRPSIMMRSLYLGLGLIALRLLLRRAGQSDLLPRLRNAGF